MLGRSIFAILAALLLLSIHDIVQACEPRDHGAEINLQYSDVVFTCTSIFPPDSPNHNVRAQYAIRSNYSFQDYASGRIYLFPVRRYLNTTPNLTCPEIGDGTANVLVAPSDEGGLQLDITNDVPGGNLGGPSTYKITAQDGTVITGWNANGKTFPAMPFPIIFPTT